MQLRSIRGSSGNLLHVSPRDATFGNPTNSKGQPNINSKRNKIDGFEDVFSRGGIDKYRYKRCRMAGGDIENTSPKFGKGWWSMRCRG